jgi:hypothetical protein
VSPEDIPGIGLFAILVLEDPTVAVLTIMQPLTEGEATVVSAGQAYECHGLMPLMSIPGMRSFCGFCCQACPSGAVSNKAQKVSFTPGCSS